jgi:hypothetical protein
MVFSFNFEHIKSLKQPSNPGKHNSFYAVSACLGSNAETKHATTKMSICWNDSCIRSLEIKTQAQLIITYIYYAYLGSNLIVLKLTDF